VARVVVLLVALGLEPCAAAPSLLQGPGHCPSASLQRLAFRRRRRLEDEAPTSWRCKGRGAILVDAPPLLPYTPPTGGLAQPTAQKPGQLSDPAAGPLLGWPTGAAWRGRWGQYR